MSMRWILLMLSAVAVFGAMLAVLAAWVVQFILLSLTERRLRLLRWVTLAAPALVLCLGILQSSAIELGLAGALLLGWALAWAAYSFQERRKEDRL